jgi:hypothetical protein
MNPMLASTTISAVHRRTFEDEGVLESYVIATSDCGLQCAVC